MNDRHIQSTIHVAEDDRDVMSAVVNSGVPGVRWRINRHDRYRFEIKMEYERSSGNKKARYQWDMFLFAPVNLGISPHTLTTEEFFDDLQTYVRFKTPDRTLERLADFTRDDHPLTQFSQNIRMVKPDQMVQRLKLFGASNVAALGDETDFLAAQLRANRDSHARISIEEVAKRLASLLDYVQAILKQFRAMRADVIGPRLDERISTALSAVNEYVSLESESILFSIARFSSRKEKLKPIAERAKEIIRHEVQHREAIGLPSVVHHDKQHDDIRNEAIPYRRGVLKKFAASSLFLEIKPSRSFQTILELIAMLAAGAAMLFAVLVAVWSSKEWAMFSLPWVVAAVVAYMFKDRMKEWMRRLGAKHLGPALPDRRFILRDDGGEALGAINERHRFIDPDNLDESIRRARVYDTMSAIEREHVPETIQRYTQRLNLKPRDSDRRIVGIYRYNVNRYTRRMDEPADRLWYLDEDDTPQSVRTAQVYLVHLVLRLKNRNAKATPPTLRTLRLVMTRKGILRIEPVSV